VGVILKSKMPAGILNTISFFIFAIFGVLSIREAMNLLFGDGSLTAIGACVAVTLVFAVVCLWTFYKKQKQSR
jgi:lipopolysaccharide export LptBFGC system permease protein LptF